MKNSFVFTVTLIILLMFSANLSAASDIDYVGKDMELKDGEMGIVSIDDTDYVGKDMELKEGEAGIISIGDGEEVAPETGLQAYAYGGGTLFLAAAGSVVLKLKKRQ